MNFISKESLFELSLLDFPENEIFSEFLCELVLSFSDFIFFDSSCELSLFHPKSGRKSSFLGVLLTSSLFLLVPGSTFSSSRGILTSSFATSWKKESTKSFDKLCIWRLNYQDY